MRLSILLAAHIVTGDELAFPIPTGDEISGEVHITKTAVSSARPRDLYQAPVEYVTQPKLDKRGQHFVSAQVCEAHIGISAIFLPCGVLRDYFYLQGASADAAQQN